MHYHKWDGYSHCIIKILTILRPATLQGSYLIHVTYLKLVQRVDVSVGRLAADTFIHRQIHVSRGIMMVTQPRLEQDTGLW